LSVGIVWLGKVESKEELRHAAEAANVDLIAVFDLTLRDARSGILVNNTTRLKITYAKKPGVVFTSDELVNLKVEQWRQQDHKGADPVETEVKQAIEALDKVLKPIPLPEALTTERAKKRIEDLVAAKPADPLPVIVEARYYVTKGLLPETEMTHAAVALLGEAEYAQLIAKSSGPSAGGAMGQMVGGALSLPGAISLVQGVNFVTGHTARVAEAKKRSAAAVSKRKSDPAAAASGGSSLKNLLPFGFGGGQGAKK
jgi:hypothetical protein